MGYADREFFSNRDRSGDFTESTAPHPRYSMLDCLSREPDQLGDIKEVVFERSEFCIRMASRGGQRSESQMLVCRRYVWRGCCRHTADKLPTIANEMVLEAVRGDRTIGTLTLRLDSEFGLLADGLYQEEVGSYRRQGGNVCEISGLAVEPRCGSKAVLASLLHLAYIFGRRQHGATDLLIEVSPHHVAYQERLLGFRQIGSERSGGRLGGAASLMHLDLDYMAEQIELFGGRRRDALGSLYPYFFAKSEEDGLKRRIWPVCQ